MQFLTSFLVCLTNFAQFQDAEVAPIDRRTFTIPISVQLERQKQIDWLYLYVSRDKGKTWKKVGGIPPDKQGFPFSAPEDGLYWFALQVVGKDLKLTPSELQPAQPALKILANTTRLAPALSDKEEIELLEKEQAELIARLKKLEKRLGKLRTTQKPKP